MNIFYKIINILKTLNWGLDLGCLNLNLNSIQIKFKLKKLNWNLIQELNMFTQTHQNIELDLGLTGPTHLKLQPYVLVTWLVLHQTRAWENIYIWG